MRVENFGRNVCFEPNTIFKPQTPDEILEALNRERPKKVRVIASGHAWSPLIETEDFLVDLISLNHVELFEENGETYARIGAGCQIQHLIDILNRSGLTLPSIGLITEQRIAGAISTGTHGSGKHSLSHYVQSVDIICYQDSQDAVLKTIDHGPELEAARCSLGCLGIIVEVVLPCVPQYLVDERWTIHKSFEDAFRREAFSPLQQFFLLPHSWKYFCQERVVSQRNRRSPFAWLYGMYWFLCFDFGIHIAILLCARWCRSKLMVRILFQRFISIFVPRMGTVTDRSDRLLTMEHELFRHLELELFVKRDQLAVALDWVTRVVIFTDTGTDHLTSEEKNRLQEWGLRSDYYALKNTHTHHYPICIRKIKADDTMISMASGCEDDWYSISFITYVEPRDQFFAMATFLARSMVQKFEARIHWGKWFPLEHAEVAMQYPRLDEFRTMAQRHDPRGIFRNQFVDRVIFGNDS